MSRAAVLHALRNDAMLNDMVPPQQIWTNYSKEGRPEGLVSQKVFFILRWGGNSAGLKNIAGPKDLVIWAHLATEVGTDYTLIDDALARAKEVLLAMEDVAGQDGYSVTSVSYNSESDDGKDPGFQTIMRQMTFQVLTRKTA